MPTPETSTACATHHTEPVDVVTVIWKGVPDVATAEQTKIAALLVPDFRLTARG